MRQAPDIITPAVAGYCDPAYPTEVTHERGDSGSAGIALLFAVSLTIAFLIGQASARPNKEEIKKGIGKVFTNRTTEADVHGRLPRLSKPLQAMYKAVVAELTKHGVWP